MALHLPVLPPLPAWLHRRPVELKPAPWPGNRRTVADDLRIAQTNEANLSRLLVAARQDADIEAARAAAFEQRATDAEAALQLARTQGAELHRLLRETTDERDRLEVANLHLRKQLDREFGYDEAAIDAIESGTGEPTGKRALT